MEVRVGEKYICKNSYNDVFTVGNEYSVEKVEYSLFYNDFQVYFSRGLNQGKYWFLLNNMTHDYYVGNFFINLRELRYNKLVKIYDKSR